MSPQVAAIAGRLAQQPLVRQHIGDAKAVERLIYMIAEAGPDPANALKVFPHAGDAVHELIGKAVAAGLYKDPETVALLKKIEYLPRSLTKEARGYVGAQAARGLPRPEALETTRFGRRPESIPRVKRLIFRKEGAPDVYRLTTTDKGEIGKILAQGYKQAGRQNISAAELERMALRPAGHPEGSLARVMYPGMEGGEVKPFKGPFYETDIAKQVGLRTR